MMSPRIGRIPIVVLLSVLANGCDSGSVPKPDPKDGVLDHSGRQLLAPGSKPSAVTALSWGGTASVRRLGAAFADGQFAVYRPERSTAPLAIGRIGTARGRLRTLLVLDGDRLVTGDRLGLTLWDIRQPRARAIDRLACGTVITLALDPIGEGNWLAGLADGRLLRFRQSGADTLDPPVAEARSTRRLNDSPTGLAFDANGREVLVVRADGHGERLRRDLSEVIESIGPSRAIATIEGRMARVNDLTELIVMDHRLGRLPGRFQLPDQIHGLAFVLKGTGLVIAGQGRWFLLHFEDGRLPRPSEVRVLPAPPGPTLVAMDPSDVARRHIALADAKGRITIRRAEDLPRLAVPLSLDEVADLAFFPHRRLYRSRPNAPRLDVPEALAERLEIARRRLDRGEGPGLLALLRELEADPALNRAAAAELATLLAATRQSIGWPVPAIARSLEQARASFQIQGKPDRAADMHFWHGMLLAPALDGSNIPVDSEPIEAAFEAFRRAGRLYRSLDPPLERQAVLCDAMLAWTLLALGDPQAAQRVFFQVRAAIEHDMVLEQVVELDRIGAALAVARRDWTATETATERLTRRLPNESHAAFRREALLERAGVLAARNRWLDAAEVLGDEALEDPEWTLRRLTVRVRAGLPVNLPDPPTRGEEPDPFAHVRARWLAYSEPQRLHEASEALAQAVAIHRTHARIDLALEAELEWAEVLERLGHYGEAASLYGQVTRQLTQELSRQRTRGTARPIGLAIGRAYRGLARCDLAEGQTSKVLLAWVQADLMEWFAIDGENLVRSAIVARDRDNDPTVRELARARSEAQLAARPTPDPPSTRLRTLEGRLAARHRVFGRDDSSSTLDLSTLDLGAADGILIFGALSDEVLAGMVIRSDRPPEVHVLPTNRTQLHIAIQSWRANLGDGGRAFEMNEPQTSDTLLSLLDEPTPPIDVPFHTFERGRAPEAYLEQVVLQPFRHALDGVESLIVVPCDPLHHFPLDVLIPSRDDRPAPILTYTPLACLFQPVRANRSDLPSANRTILIVSRTSLAEPLVVSGIHRKAGANVTTLEEGSASGESWLSVSSGRLDCLQFFGPPMLEPDPEPSRRWDQGRLTSSELLRRDQNANIVCLTFDANPTTPPSGPAWLRLARAWHSLGTSAFVCNLWDVPEPARLVFLSTFHQALADGANAPRAFVLARRAVRERPEFQNPVHWAGFVFSTAGPTHF